MFASLRLGGKNLSHPKAQRREDAILDQKPVTGYPSVNIY
jgi:hypothetical protein